MRHSIEMSILFHSAVWLVWIFPGMVALFIWWDRSRRLIENNVKHICLCQFFNSWLLFRVWWRTTQFGFFSHTSASLCTLELEVALSNNKSSYFKVDAYMITDFCQINWMIEDLINDCLCKVLTLESCSRCNNLPVKFYWSLTKSNNWLNLFWIVSGVHCLR